MAHFSDYSLYTAALPARLQVHPDFGADRWLLATGMMEETPPASSADYPVFTITDKLGRVAIRIVIDPAAQSVTMASELNSVSCA